MNGPTAEQIAKLPAWARSHILFLSNKLEHAEGQLAAMDNPDSIVSWSDSIGPDHGLPPRATIEFKTGSGRMTVRLMSDGESVNVNGEFTLSIIPKASNDFSVRGTK